MYLISAYFDEETNNRIQQYINQVAKKTGNYCMVDGKVPPHITISSFKTNDIGRAMSLFEQRIAELQQGVIHWTSVGVFLPYVIYLSPVLNTYLHQLCEDITGALKHLDGIQLSPYYQPFNWVPHTTIGKQLSKEEMQIAFQVLQHQFGPFEGRITQLGLAKTNPYEDIMIYNLSK